MFLQRTTGTSQSEVNEFMSTFANALGADQKRNRFACIDIGFNAIEDDSFRLALNAIPTRLSLSRKEVDTLVAAGRFIVRKRARELDAIRNLVVDPDRAETESVPLCRFGAHPSSAQPEPAKGTR